MQQKSWISINLKFHFHNQQLSHECSSHKRIGQKIIFITFPLFFFLFFVILQLISLKTPIKVFETPPFMDLLPQYLLAIIKPFPISLRYLTIYSDIMINRRSRRIWSTFSELNVLCSLKQVSSYLKFYIILQNYFREN